MDVKQVMENLEALKYCDSLFGNKNEESKLNDAINLIWQGEKYRKMWEEVEHALTDSEDYNEYSWSPKAREIMKDIEIKYFPKEVK